MVYFFVDEEEKCKEKKLYSTVNGKVSQSSGKNRFFFFFLTNEQKFEFFYFLSHKIKYFKSSAINVKLSQQNLGNKLLKLGKK